MSRQYSRVRSTSEVYRENQSPSRTRRPSLQHRTYSASDAEGLRQASRPPTRGHDISTSAVIEEDEAQSPSSADYGGQVAAGGPAEATMSKPRLPQVNLAVLGVEGVGKSTFVKCALDLKQLPVSLSSVKKMSLDGKIYIVRLLEISLHKITFDETGRIVWPKFPGEHELPIDGVLTLFNSTDPNTIVQISQAQKALSKSTLPYIAVACKSPVQPYALDPAIYEQAQRILGTLQVHQTSPDAPESQKKCISIILKAIFARSAAQRTQSTSRTRSTTSVRGPPRTSSIPNRQHIRASSENPISRPSDTIPADRPDRVPADSSNDPNVALNVHSSRNVRSNSQPIPPRTPPGGRLNRGAPPNVSETLPEDTPPSKNPYQRLRTSWRHSAASDAFSSFLDMEDDGDDSNQGSGAPPSPDAGSNKQPSDPGQSFDELVDRLLSLPLSKQDAKFPNIFLCLYRKFATPARLLNAIVSRFEQAGSNRIPQLTRHADQLRILNVMAQWVSEYPGDFAGSKTRKRLTDFVSSLEKQMVFAFAAKEINSCLEKFVEDDDLGWAFNDDGDGSESVETFLDTSVQSSPATFIAEEPDDAINNMSALDLSEDNPELSSQYSTTSSIYRSGSISSQSLLTLMSVETAQQEAARLELTPRHAITKEQWKLFMEIPDEEFAREVTRIDWVMYSSFRPRELIRHVSTTSNQKEKGRGVLENVNRMIKVFNHLALFVGSMVLFRDKPKHRAQALEKFMNIAMKLRQLKNYNSLGAVIAGLNGTPVIRLSQTRDLVSPHVQKQFMSLIILMGTQKSYFAYRLAWENSFSERIPFLPLHLRDLVSAEEGNKTFVGGNTDRINWRKFEVMGEVVLGIQQSQRTPFPLHQRSTDVQQLLLEAKFAGDEDDLYSRSMQVEPSSTGGEPHRKRFGWLRN
ncbi:hypothetical protein AJ80_03756 [Polytolypa hystricis UAMH7299]|uniref:Ras-GEF domain-containing protein n=1 Tax=Polytolypa hystricis (strain UAMH7299) TaxID=1447883 RepID=A0A2B7YFI7_POLH7|nr:hypothetical protein AJ80_03756 [Polytolypa hystricis UAMH7299]